MDQCWELENGECLETPPEGYYGYVYIIYDDKGGWYIGKKAFSHTKKTKLSKKARIGTRKRIKIEQKDSGWLNYWGSCKPLLEYIKERGGCTEFKRKILQFCETKQELSYWEAHHLCVNYALFDPKCWNSNILNRFFRGKIK